MNKIDKFLNENIYMDGFNFSEIKEKFIKLSIRYLKDFYRKMMNAVELYIEEKSR